MITTFKKYEPMKKWISYDYYCQTTQEFYDEVTNLFFWYWSLFLPKI
jgi:hypothetical protein